MVQSAERSHEDGQGSGRPEGSASLRARQRRPARSERTFWRIMKRCGVRYVTATPNHNCEIHKNAEVNKRQIATEENELKKMEADLEDARE